MGAAGLQCMFEVFGGVVSHAGEIVHGKTSPIHHDGKGCFTGEPSAAGYALALCGGGGGCSAQPCCRCLFALPCHPSLMLQACHRQSTRYGITASPGGPTRCRPAWR